MGEKFTSCKPVLLQSLCLSVPSQSFSKHMVLSFPVPHLLLLGTPMDFRGNIFLNERKNISLLGLLELLCISTGHCIFCITAYNKVYYSYLNFTFSPPPNAQHGRGYYIFSAFNNFTPLMQKTWNNNYIKILKFVLNNMFCT